MTKTTLEQFRAELLATGGYQTPPERLAPQVRKPGRLTTLGFVWSVLSVFVRSSIAEWRGVLNTDLWAKFCFYAVQKAESYGTKVWAEGWNNRRDYKGPVVYLANHMSTTETTMLPFVLLTFGPFSTVVKKSIMEIPGLGKSAAHMGLVPIGRTNPREDLMTIFNVCGDRIRNEQHSVLIFAQGTRVPVFARKGWSSIGAKLAEKTGVPVVPVAIKTDIMLTHPENKGFSKDFGTVDPSKDIRMACGPVLTGSAREMNQAAFDWIATKLEEWNMPVERS